MAVVAAVLVSATVTSAEAVVASSALLVKVCTSATGIAAGASTAAAPVSSTTASTFWFSATGVGATPGAALGGVKARVPPVTPKLPVNPPVPSGIASVLTVVPRIPAEPIGDLIVNDDPLFNFFTSVTNLP